MDIEELDQHINERIQGVFSKADMGVLKEEASRLEPGDVYLEIGVNEGKSFRSAWEFVPKGVFVIGIDIFDVTPHRVSIGRAPFFESEGMVGIGKRGFYIHGDADEFVELWNRKINLLFIDGHHDYESVKKNTLLWEAKVARGGTILFHDYDHPETKQWLDEYYGNRKEVLHNKIVRVRR